MSETKQKTRYQFKKDDDGHSYVVPVTMADEFDRLLEEATGSDDYDEFNDKFGDMLVGWGITFTEPQDNEGTPLFDDKE